VSESGSSSGAAATTLPDWLFMACGLSWGAALIHISAAIGHVHESGLYVLFFALLAPTQLAWGFLVCRRQTRELLLAGVALSLLVATVWLMSRTTGLPVGPEPWHPEAVGAVDAIATADELGLALLVWLYGFSGLHGRAVRALGVGAKVGALALVVLSSLALLAAGHGT